MALLVDTFWTEAQARLESAGWIILSGSRYDPTDIIGITPSGKAARLTIVDGTVTLDIAGRTRTTNYTSREEWEPGEKTVQAVVDTYNKFPANQR